MSHKRPMGGAKAEQVRQAIRDGFCYSLPYGVRGRLYGEATAQGAYREVSPWHLTRLWVRGEIGPVFGDLPAGSHWTKLGVKEVPDG